MDNTKYFYFIYGNHGDFPEQLEDYYFLIKDLLAYSLNKPLLVSKELVSGHCNFIIECFNPSFVSQIETIKNNSPKTNIICIATEFLTQDTFNLFNKENEYSNQTLIFLDSILHQTGIVKLGKKFFSDTSLKDLYKKYIKNKIGSSHYANTGYWKERYNNFIKSLPYFDQVWTVSPSQKEGYLRIIESSNLWTLPIVPYTDLCEEFSSTKNNNFNIDLLFTGTLTPYRIQILEKLKNKKLNVVSGFFPSFLKNAYISQSKICLNLKPNSKWPFTSIMRLHTLLMKGKYVISEKYDDEISIQNKFVNEVTLENIVSVSLDQINNPNLVDIGIEMKSKYIESTKIIREKVKGDFLEFIQSKIT